ncbi:MAG: hypothetical protein WB791_10420 [Waddliaceae bacterium]
MWKSSGWTDAADYHFYTWDAPFLDYTKEGKGHDIDRKKMADLQKSEPDIFRCKIYCQQRLQIPLPSVEVIPDSASNQLSTTDRVKYLLACVFGKIGEKPCHWTDVPLIRRSSPSGGCRHPSEGYFLSSKALNMESGFYHVQTDPLILNLLSTQFDEISQIIVPEEEDNSEFLGAIVISTVFERNMYRYREPRTFRTVHMDAGHLIGSIEILGSELGFKVTPYLRFDEDGILNIMKTSKLNEGVMALITLKKSR